MGIARPFRKVSRAVRAMKFASIKKKMFASMGVAQHFRKVCRAFKAIRCLLPASL